MEMSRQRIPLQAGTAIWFSVPVPQLQAQMPGRATKDRRGGLSYLIADL
jgi:hypothetical protein